MYSGLYVRKHNAEFALFSLVLGLLGVHEGLHVCIRSRFFLRVLDFLGMRSAHQESNLGCCGHTTTP